MTDNVQISRRDTVQVLPIASPYGNTSYAGADFFGGLRGPLLPAWGTHEREVFLRQLYRNDYNWMFQGAVGGTLKRIASTPWVIKGPKDLSKGAKSYYADAYHEATGRRSKGGAQHWIIYNWKEYSVNGVPGGRGDEFLRSDIEYWQSVLRQAQFGRGWGDFIKMGTDFFRQDAGWYWELIAPGDPNGPPNGPITGIAHLDSLRCIPTGDPEFPIVYWDRRSTPHKMHYTRIVQLQDMPEHDELQPGYGLCALSRAAAIVDRELWMGRYVSSMLDDKPPPGIVLATGFNKQQRDAQVRMYKEEQNRDERPPWGKQLWFYSMDVNFPAKIEVKTFQTPPEKFDFNIYTEIDINALALALGVDKQDLWQLSGRMAGTAAQSEVLTQKSRGKTLGDLMATIERSINDFLPEEYIFEFKGHDTLEEMEKAQTAGMWASVVKTVEPFLTQQEARRVLAEQIEPIHNVLTDDSGQIVNVGDRDTGPLPEEVKPNETALQPGQTTMPDATGGQTAGDLKPGVSPGGRTTSAVGYKHDPLASGREGDDAVPADAEVTAAALKQIQATLLNFEMDFADLVSAGLKGEVSRARFGIVGRAILSKYGRMAYQDGLKAGGIEDGQMSDDDNAEFALWLATTNGYFGQFAERVYSGQSQMNADTRAQAWAEKSIMDAFRDGQISADKNALYEWSISPNVEKHCGVCPSLDGQIHRLSTWKKRNLMPKSEALPCSIGCACTLIRRTGRARGTLPRSVSHAL